MRMSDCDYIEFLMTVSVGELLSKLDVLNCLCKPSRIDCRTNASAAVVLL